MSGNRDFSSAAKVNDEPQRWSYLSLPSAFSAIASSMSQGGKSQRTPDEGTYLRRETMSQNLSSPTRISCSFFVQWKTRMGGYNA